MLICFGLEHSSRCSTLSENTKIETIDDFSGGLNTLFPKRKVLKNQSVNTYNFLVDEKPGSLVKRKGFTVVGSTTSLSKISKAFLFIKDNGSKEYLVSDSSRMFSTVDFKIFTVVKNTMTTTAIPDMVQARNKVWVTNGVDPVFTWDGSAVQVLDGSGNTPNVPRCKYIEFFQERIFLFNSSASNSASYFSNLTSTDGIAITLDDSRAWPTENQLNIGQGDGQRGTGMAIFRGVLTYHKDQSIYKLFGIDSDTYFARKSNSEVGSISDESISVHDNFQYFLGKDGIYAFDGNDAIRISDLISPDIGAVSSNLTNIVSNIWDTKSTFEKGIFSGSSTTSSGSLIVFGTPTVNYLDGGSLIALDNHLFNTSRPSFTPNIDITTNVFSIPSSSYSMRLNKITFETHHGGASTYDFRVCFRNKSNGNEICEIKNTGNAVGTEKDQTVIFGSTFNITSNEILSSSLTYSLNMDTTTFPQGVGAFLRISSFGTKGRAEIFMANSTGQFISEISTLTTVTYWDTFLANQNTNGGNIKYFIRAATAIANISTETWVSIYPGSLINFPTDKRFVQWATTITGPSAEINDVTIKHNEGTSTDARPISVFWGNRLWLSVTTNTSSNNSLIYVKSKITNFDQNSFVKFLGINVKSLVKDGEDIFYAGSSTSGSILRLDYGTNDNGLAIDSVWETPSLSFGNPYFSKKLTKVILEGKKSNESTTISLGFSEDEGGYTNKTVDFSGFGKALVFVNSAEFKGATVGFRIRNNDLDRTPEICSLGILYEDTKIEVNK